MPAAIFLTPGAEPSGRFGRGIVELIAIILLFIPKTVACDAVLFVMAVVTMACGIVILVLQHNDFTSLFDRKNPASS